MNTDEREHILHHCKSLVPLSTMRAEHLATALAGASLQMIFRGDSLALEQGDHSHLYYLLSGELSLEHDSGRKRIVTADFHWLPIVQYQSEQFSATAITDCELLCFQRQQLDDLLTWSQVADYLDVDISYDRNLDEDAGWMSTILNSNLFYKIPPINVLAIHRKVTPRDVRAGEVILEQGAVGDYCYFIKEGQALVTQTDDQGQRQELATISDGRCFGEDALIQQTTRNATVTMLTDGTLMCLHKDDFAELLQAPAVSHLSFTQLSAIGNQQITYLDVRTQEEFDYKHIVGAVHIPLTLLRLKIRLLDPKVHYLVYCNTGSRSGATAFLLASKGFNVSVLDQGLAGLSEQQVAELLVSEYDDIHRLAASGFH